MLYLCIFLTLLLLTLTQFGLLLCFKKTALVATYLGINSTSLVPKYILSISTVIFFILLYYFLKLLSTPEPMSKVLYDANPRQISNTVKQIRIETYPTVQNYYYFYSGTDKSASTLEAIAKSLKTSECKKACTINLYDNLNAYQIDRERVSITDSKEMVAWNKRNYVFIAEHYLGYLDSAAYPSFTYYPYKDWYYNQLTKKASSD